MTPDHLLPGAYGAQGAGGGALFALTCRALIELNRALIELNRALIERTFVLALFALTCYAAVLAVARPAKEASASNASTKVQILTPDHLLPGANGADGAGGGGAAAEDGAGGGVASQMHKALTRFGFQESHTPPPPHAHHRLSATYGGYILDELLPSPTTPDTTSQARSITALLSSN